MNYKYNNDKIALDYIRRNPACSRIHIQESVGLSKAATANIVNRLLEAGFIYEANAQLKKQLKGKPYKILYIEPKKAYFLGISIRLWNINICIMDFNLKIIWEKEVHFLGIFQKEKFQKKYDELIIEAAKNIPHGYSIQHIGIALPATINKGNIIDFTLHEREISNIDIISILEKSFPQTPFKISHHGLILSYFETIKNKRTPKNIFMLILDYGIGGSLIFKGRNYKGAHSYAGNIGAFFPYDQPRPTVIDLAQKLNYNVTELTTNKIDALYQKKDALLMEWISDHAKNLSMPLSTAVEFFDPQEIILGGFFPQSVLKALKDGINLNLLESPERITKKKAKIKIASHVGPIVFAYGAACFALKNYLKHIFKNSY